MSAPRKRTRPEDALYWWVRHLKNVLLPAPFGPIRQRSSPFRHREVDVVDRDHTAEAHGEPVRLQNGHRRSSPYRSPRRSLPPSPNRLPRSSAAALAVTHSGHEALGKLARGRQQTGRHQQHEHHNDPAEDEIGVGDLLLADLEL